jgi:hypothetical protein
MGCQPKTNYSRHATIIHNQAITLYIGKKHINMSSNLPGKLGGGFILLKQ